jgi:DnaK suppressor protein
MKKPPGKETPNKATAAKESVSKEPMSKETVSKEPASKESSTKEPAGKEPGGKPKAKVAAEEAPVSAAPKVRMGKTELKFFENLLNEKKETLLQELGYLEDNTMRLSSKEGAGDLSSHAYHLADHATETQDREQAFHMASREGKFLYYIEEALDRVRNGTFGICKKCGKLIPKPRLEAVPTAKMCIDCKTAQERAAEAASLG